MFERCERVSIGRTGVVAELGVVEIGLRLLLQEIVIHGEYLGFALELAGRWHSQ